jgi:hypothetical protein
MVLVQSRTRAKTNLEDLSNILGHYQRIIDVFGIEVMERRENGLRKRLMRKPMWEAQQMQK